MNWVKKLRKPTDNEIRWAVGIVAGLVGFDVLASHILFCLSPPHGYTCVAPTTWWKGLAESDQAQWAAGLGTIAAIYVTQRIASSQERARQRELKDEREICTVKFATGHYLKMVEWCRQAHRLNTMAQDAEFPSARDLYFQDAITSREVSELLPQEEHIDRILLQPLLRLLRQVQAFERTRVRLVEYHAYDAPTLTVPEGKAQLQERIKAVYDAVDELRHAFEYFAISMGGGYVTDSALADRSGRPHSR